jgi:hypothetical protein
LLFVNTVRKLIIAKNVVPVIIVLVMVLLSAINGAYCVHNIRTILRALDALSTITPSATQEAALDQVITSDGHARMTLPGEELNFVGREVAIVGVTVAIVLIVQRRKKISRIET